MDTGFVSAAPMAWWRPDTYLRALEICADRDEFRPTFEEWRKHAQKFFDELQSEGLPVVKVLLDPEELLIWAAAEGRDIDAKTHAAFAMVVYERENRQRH